MTSCNERNEEIQSTKLQVDKVGKRFVNSFIHMPLTCLVFISFIVS